MSNDIAIKIRVDANTGELKVLSNNFDTLSSKLQSSELSITKFSGSLANIAHIGQIAGISIADLYSKISTLSIKTLEYNQKIAEISTLSSSSSKQIRKLSQDVLSLQSSFSKLEISQALYDAQSAGVEFSKSLEFVKDAQNLAIARNAALSSSIDILTTVVNAYSDSAQNASKYSDVMFETVKLSKTTVTELGTYLGEVASVAASAGVQFEELGAAIATMTSFGIRKGLSNSYGQIHQKGDWLSFNPHKGLLNSLKN